jgi:hypothetical protein
MKTSQDIRKKARSGRAVRPKPQDLALINEDLNVREYFEQVRCMCYCENIKGYNTNWLKNSLSGLMGYA